VTGKRRRRDGDPLQRPVSGKRRRDFDPYQWRSDLHLIIAVGVLTGVGVSAVWWVLCMVLMPL
jgi:hypothetical protein